MTLFCSDSCSSVRWIASVVSFFSSISFSFALCSVLGIQQLQYIPLLGLAFPGASVTLSKVHYFVSLSLPSTVTVSNVTDMIFTGQTVFDNNSVKCEFAMGADQSPAPAVCQQRLFFQIELPRVSYSSVERAILSGLASLKLGICSLAEDIQFAKESVSKGNWLWRMGRNVCDGTRWV